MIVVRVFCETWMRKSQNSYLAEDSPLDKYRQRCLLEQVTDSSWRVTVQICDQSMGSNEVHRAKPVIGTTRRPDDMEEAKRLALEHVKRSVLSQAAKFGLKKSDKLQNFELGVWNDATNFRFR